jgi:hypothetical protein
MLLKVSMIKRAEKKRYIVSSTRIEPTSGNLLMNLNPLYDIPKATSQKRKAKLRIKINFSQGSCLICVI